MGDPTDTRSQYGTPVDDSLPMDYTFGDLLDWSSASIDVTITVELPFWLMVDDCDMTLETDGATVQVRMRDRYVQLFAGPVGGSGHSLVWQGPETETPQLTASVIDALEREGASSRLCRSVMKLSARAHRDVIEALGTEHDGTGDPRRIAEARAYLASLCEAHIPIINNFIQRYRLVTYDYVPYEVSPWDVPVWMVVTPDGAVVLTLLVYAEWDRKPTIRDQDRTEDPEAAASPFRFADPADIAATDPLAATPGEFDLLDARSLMERGDYTGAIRRSVTAIEAVVEHALRRELAKTYASAEVERRLAASETDYPGRYRQWKRLSNVSVSAHVEEAFDETRKVRHSIVHKGLRLTPANRGQAQKSVDTARWLFNTIESDSARVAVREKPNPLRDVGRVALAPRFDTDIVSNQIVVLQPNQPDPAPDGQG